ncbi:MAG: sulfatase-like hydrolase/transferase, partial [Candidatus Rokuibacteriota bacterium]
IPELREDLWAERQRQGQPAYTPPEANGAAPARPPHIVFVMVDTLRADALRAYGAERPLMPQLERIAARSIVFRDVLVNSSWTRPSVASFFTGLLPEEHGAVDRANRLPERWWVLAEILRARGYATAAFVSNYGAVGRDAGFDQGFDHFEQLEGRPYARAARVNAAVERWLERFRRSGQRRELPLFLYVHYLDPHYPDLAGYTPPSLETSEMRRGYDAELRYLDAWLVRLYDFLEAQLRAPRFVLLTSDHGEEFGEHGDGGHGHSLYDEVVRVPALLTGGENRSGLAEARLEARDFFDLLQRLAREPELDVAAWAARRDRGQRYLSTWGGTQMGWHRPYRRYVGLRGIEKDGFFLVWSAYGNTWELYDLRRDPGQLRNVVRQHPERRRELAAAMEESVGWWTERVPIQHSDQTLDLLRELGYVE